MPLFCHSLRIDKRRYLFIDEPFIIAANHPNSFLDAVLVDILFNKTVWSLARGDVFRSKFISKLLGALKMLPVHRAREGISHLNNNYTTFETCMDIFKLNQSVLIFSEGQCINEWHLRSLKKGTARLAFQAWKNGIPVKVLPVGINYSSFTRYGKKINIHIANPIQLKDFDLNKSDGFNYLSFNTLLRNHLATLVYEIKPGDIALQKKKFPDTCLLQKLILLPFSLIGMLLHAPLYLSIKFMIEKRTKNSDHFDSVMFGILIFTYPFYLAIIAFLCFKILGFYSLVAFLIFPATASCYAKFKVRRDNNW